MESRHDIFHLVLSGLGAVVGMLGFKDQLIRVPSKIIQGLALQIFKEDPYRRYNDDDKY